MNKNILITGRPGIGKTTLIKRLLTRLSINDIGGFYTEEIKKGDKRTGFILKTIEGNSCILASITYNSAFKVGRYRVDIEEFEKIGVKSINEAVNKDKKIIIIDEIGKMELYSDKFKKAVISAMNTGRVIATIKLGGNGFLKKLKTRNDTVLIHIDIHNRNQIIEAILRLIEY